MPAAAAAAHMKAVTVDTDGGIVVAGQSPENGGDIWVRKYFQ